MPSYPAGRRLGPVADGAPAPFARDGRPDVSTDTATDFFYRLGAEGHQALLNRISGTLRFDVDDGPTTEHWYVRVDKGDVAVSHEDLPADAVVHIGPGDFGAMAEGRLNAIAAFLRGEIHLEGDVGLVISFQRLFPGPPSRRPQ
jgi:hypothetical protein